VARAEVRRAEALVEQLELRSPIAGIVYKMDVRLGEMLVAGGEGECPIVLGSPRLWVRLYVESFWAPGVSVGSSFDVYDSETGELIGTGEIISKTQYVGRKAYRTDEPGERFDTGYQEAVLELESAGPGVPVGLAVFARMK
jgi:hypothetical protein